MEMFLSTRDDYDTAIHLFSINQVQAV